MHLPAAPLAKQAGARPVILNRDPTGQDEIADLVLRPPIGATLAGIDEIVAGS